MMEILGFRIGEPLRGVIMFQSGKFDKDQNDLPLPANDIRDLQKIHTALCAAWKTSESRYNRVLLACMKKFAHFTVPGAEAPIESIEVGDGDDSEASDEDEDEEEDEAVDEEDDAEETKQEKKETKAAVAVAELDA